MAEEKKIYGPKSRQKAYRRIHSALNMIRMALPMIHCLDFEDEPGAEDGYYERQAAGDILKRAKELIGKAQEVMTFSPIDEHADVQELMRRAIEPPKDDPNPPCPESIEQLCQTIEDKLPARVA